GVRGPRSPRPKRHGRSPVGRAPEIARGVSSRDRTDVGHRPWNFVRGVHDRVPKDRRRSAPGPCRKLHTLLRRRLEGGGASSTSRNQTERWGARSRTRGGGWSDSPGGVEGLHGVLPVKRRTDSGADSDKEPHRLALAMWYVADPKLEEYVLPIQKQTMESMDNGSNSRAKPRKHHDPNYPDAPKELFVLFMPNEVDPDSLLHSVGSYQTGEAERLIGVQCGIGQFLLMYTELTVNRYCAR
ncbi:hypothetical protein ACHAWF_000383, partial [Thalassiosira exigua]